MTAGLIVQDSKPLSSSAFDKSKELVGLLLRTLLALDFTSSSICGIIFPMLRLGTLTLIMFVVVSSDS